DRSPSRRAGQVREARHRAAGGHLRPADRVRRSPGSSMRLRLAAASAGVALLTVCAGSALAASSAQAPQLNQTKLSQFPNRAYVLTLPHPTQVDPESISVFENGQPVDSPSVDLPG